MNTFDNWGLDREHPKWKTVRRNLNKAYDALEEAIYADNNDWAHTQVEVKRFFRSVMNIGLDGNKAPCVTDDTFALILQRLTTLASARHRRIDLREIREAVKAKGQEVFVEMSG